MTTQKNFKNPEDLVEEIKRITRIDVEDQAIKTSIATSLLRIANSLEKIARNFPSDDGK